MEQLRQISLAAVNIDGVLLNDTFSPVIHRFVTSRGGRYDAEVEREIFSQPQLIAAKALGAAAGLDASPADVLTAYFEEREAHLAEHPLRLLDGAVELLHRLRGLGLRTVCYGGLDKTHFDRHLRELAHLFDGPGYVCTNDFRPGVHEITTEVFGLRHDQALFIDDVARVAEAAKELGVPFIGHPSDFAHGFQGELMRRAGVRHLVGSLDEIDEPLLRTLDAEAAAGRVWNG
ncbi:HAD family phosphatase [Streptomyces sp. ISL-36]|uniref:HAD family phosphatase n=1 Tax=Streptomyces sp. ISL-36 TaxID=2819182 RepID=UPI0027E3DF45|nr:HAD family phosphatase [Streptomyces sp. ISL-36]